jgi:hypothetical protein
MTNRPHPRPITSGFDNNHSHAICTLSQVPNARDPFWLSSVLKRWPPDSGGAVIFCARMPPRGSFDS